MQTNIDAEWSTPGAFPELGELVLDLNSIGGALPEDLGLALQSLVTFSCQGCGLTGTLPAGELAQSARCLGSFVIALEPAAHAIAACYSLSQARVIRLLAVQCAPDLPSGDLVSSAAMSVPIHVSSGSMSRRLGSRRLLPSAH